MLTARQQFDNLTDALVEDILNMSDEEILAECREDGKDPEVIAAWGRGIFERAKLISARAGVVRHHGINYAVTWDECPFCGMEAAP